MKTLFAQLRTRGASIKLAVAGAALVAASSAHAALPDWATAMFTQLTSDVGDVLAAVGPIVMIVLGGFTVLRLIKRGARQL